MSRAGVGVVVLSLVAVAAAIKGGFAKMGSLNVRNNNPLNIKISADWAGESFVQSHHIFEVFASPRFGFRAAYIILLQYLERGDNTISSVISKWAPANTDEQNHTGNYIDYVADKMQMSPAEYLLESDLPKLMLYMSEFEGGNGHFTLAQAVEGVELAKREDFVLARLDRLGVSYV